jgi:tetratricopeptide (TPR) repeat protein
MAKRPAEDDEDEAPKVRKRRRPKKKADDDDDEGAGRPTGKRPADDDEEDEESSISTGNVILDIVLDFRDDCIDWAKEHFLYAVIIVVTAFLVFAIVSSLTIHSWYRYLTRPTLSSVLKTYDIGAYGDAKLYADEALVYVSPSDMITRAGLAFVQGAANVAVGDSVPEIDKLPYYLTAANYLQESAQYGFVEGRTSDGFFLLGKSLYLCGELVKCRKPLEASLDKTTPHRKMILWYLANAYCFGESPDMQLAAGYLERFHHQPLVTEAEFAESKLLSALIELQNGQLDEAEKIFDTVPHFQRFVVMRNYIEGLINFLHARNLREQAIHIEENPNPLTPELLPTAPAPVKPVKPVKPADGAQPGVVAPAPVTRNTRTPSELRLNTDLQFNDTAPAPVFGFDSPYSKRLAQLQPKYGDGAEADEDKVIVLPEDDDTQKPPNAPQPPESGEGLSPQSTVAADTIQERIKDFYNAAAERYKNAIGYFTFVMRQATPNSRFSRLAGLFVGICSDELNTIQPKIGGKLVRSGAEYFNNLIESYPQAPETAAASFFVGQQDRKRGKTEMSYRDFARTCDILRKVPGYYNPWISKSDITTAMLEHIRSGIERRDPADSIMLLKLARGVISATDEARLRGETYESWSALLSGQAESVFGETGDKLVKEAEEKLRLAGKAFDDYADINAGTPLYAANIWRSANNFREGKDYRNAIIEYKKYAKADYTANRPALYLYLGEMYLNVDALQESVSVLEDALKDYPSDDLVPAMRLVLSRAYQELTLAKTADVEHNSAEAKKLLQLNLAGEYAPSSAVYRDSLYALGQWCYQRDELPEAEAYLEDAVRIHPNSAQTADGHYTLALCYQKSAENELKKIDDSSTEAMQGLASDAAREERQKALTNMKSVIAVLTRRQRGIGLADAEKLMLRNAQFALGTLLLKMEMFNEAMPVLNQTAMQYQNRPEALDALISLAYILRKTGRKEQSLAMLNRAEVLLNQLTQSGTIRDTDNWKNLIDQEKRK